MTPDLVVLDIDHTITDADDRIHPLTTEALDRLRAHPIPVALATGRPLSSALRVARTVHARFIVALGGAVVMRVHDEVTLWTAPTIPPSITAGLWTSGAHVHAHRADGHWHATHDGPITDEYTRVHHMPGALWSMPDRGVLLEVVDQQLDPQLHPDATVMYGYAHGHHYTDLTARGVDKATGLSHLVRHLDIDWSSVLAMGDGDNDCTVFQAAGCSVAVQGATPGLLEHATHEVMHPAETGAVGAAVMALVYGSAAHQRVVKDLR